jgi:hypothetical protein
MSKVVRSTVMSDVESTFYAAVDVAQGVLQSSLIGATPATARAANIAYHRSVVAAAAASGQPHLGTPSLYALRDLTGGQ